MQIRGPSDAITGKCIFRHISANSADSSTIKQAVARIFVWGLGGRFRSKVGPFLHFYLGSRQ